MSSSTGALKLSVSSFEESSYMTPFFFLLFFGFSFLTFGGLGGFGVLTFGCFLASFLAFFVAFSGWMVGSGCAGADVDASSLFGWSSNGLNGFLTSLESSMESLDLDFFGLIPRSKDTVFGGLELIPGLTFGGGWLDKATAAAPPISEMSSGLVGNWMLAILGVLRRAVSRTPPFVTDCVVEDGQETAGGWERRPANCLWELVVLLCLSLAFSLTLCLSSCSRCWRIPPLGGVLGVVTEEVTVVIAVEAAEPNKG